MTRRRRLFAATIGLLLVAAPIAPLRAQTTTTTEAPSCPPAASDLDRIRADVIAPATTDPPPSPNQRLAVQFTNTAEGFATQTPRITEVRGEIMACRSGQLLPPESTNTVKGTSTALTDDWTATFETNGPYVVVFTVDGDRPTPTGPVAQHGRMVLPFSLAVPPKKPTGVKASTSNGVVTVTWSNADREKDLIAYEVRRAKQGSATYVTVNDGLVAPNVNAVSDSPAEGAWRYQVISYRSDVPDGATSSDATVEVAAPAPTGTTPTSGGGTTSGGAGSTTGSGSDSTGTTTVGGRPSATDGGSTVDLSNFARALNARRATPTARIEPPDPGFEETLPFGAADELGAEEDPQELGTDEPNVGIGQRIAADPSERRRSLGFVAFGLLLFVLSMTGLFVKSEVNRADLLGLDAIDGDEPEPDGDPDTVAPVVVAAVATRRSRRTRAPAPGPADEPGNGLTPGDHLPEVPPSTPIDHFADLVDPHAADVATARTAARRARREVAPLDAPGLDVPEPASRSRAKAATRATDRDHREP